MFTGLIDDVGLITTVGDGAAGRELRVRCRYRDLVDGESIALNGVCLTVRAHGDEGVRVSGERSDLGSASATWFTVAAVVTTLGRTCIGEWTAGTPVNLERAMRLGDRLGGHLVLGHVDDVATVTCTEERGDALLIDVALPPSLQPLMAQHGSVTVDGVSLTVNELISGGVQLSIIEYTRRHTTLGNLAAGHRVHVEADVLAKHVARLLAPHLAHTSSRASSPDAGAW